jgi:hypothetical protein
MNPCYLRAVGASFCVAIGLFAGGCGSMSSIDLPDFNYSQNRTFPKDPDTVFDASQAALTEMNYKLVRGSRAGGKLEMAAGINPGSALRARQRNVEVTVEELDSGDSVVRVVFREAGEDISPGGTVTATNHVIREGTLYQVFWERLATKLGLSAAAPQTGAP